jgi:tetratricopeptide (TPR) repeat protein
LKGRRQQLHARIAKVLQGSHPELVAQQPEFLAHHLAEAGLTAKAVELWTAAGERALARAAAREASGFFERALMALGGLEQTPEVLAGTLDLHHKLYFALHRFGEMHRARANLAEAERLATRLNDSTRLCRILYDITYILASMGAAGAIDTGKRALALAARSDDLVAHTGGRLMLARALYAQGRYQESINHIRAVIAILGEDLPLGQLGPGWLNQTVSARVWLALCCAELGEFEESAASAAMALRLSARLDGKHEESLWSRIAIGRLAVLQGHFAKVVETLEPTLPLCEAELAVYFSRIASSLGIAYAHLGNVEKGLALLRQAVSRAQTMGFLYLSGLVLAQLGEAYLLAGDTANAQEAGMRALEAARSSGEESSEAWALWLLGEVASRLDSPEAAARYREAEGIADRLDMAPLSARCQERLERLG